MPTKNDVAWERYITEENLQLDGRTHSVNAAHLKSVAQREPRLMMKFDTPDQLPKILRKNGYAAVAIAHGDYLLFPGSVFQPVDRCQQKATFQSQTRFPLATVGRGTGESEYLDNAFNAGIIAAFTNNDALYLTIRGRERTRPFDFQLRSGDSPIAVNGVQIEADAGYEGAREIILIEAKIGAPSHFNIRQLYYPFRHFAIIAPQKRIRTLFFAYDLSAATYTFYEFVFDDTQVFDSIRQTRCCVYSLVPRQAYTIDTLLDARFETANHIVPQADDLNKIFELLTLINRGHNTVSDIADYFVFAPRQSQYYGEAAEYLGLITRKRGVFELTERGIAFIATPPEKQQVHLAKLIINSWVFRGIIALTYRRGFFTLQDIEEVIKTARTSEEEPRYTQSTVKRRRRTVIAWVNWLAEQLQVFAYEDNAYYFA